MGLKSGERRKRELRKIESIPELREIVENKIGIKSLLVPIFLGDFHFSS